MFAACVTEVVSEGVGAQGPACVGCIGEIISVGEFDTQQDQLILLVFAIVMHMPIPESLHINW